ncbi:MAG: hypothetical protein Q4C42_12055, partial [Clostridia bacterium]|nr:hypothetical protein [Clostridia bacterium]
KYRLYIYNSSKQLQYDSGLLTATSKSATKTLKPGTYYFKVKAQKITTSYATGKYSFKLNVAGTIPSETELTATPGFNQIKLTWKQVPTASGYMIYRSSGTGYNLIKKTTSPETLSVRDLTAIPGVKYSYKVRAYNSVGVGPSSNVVAGISKLATPAINVTNQNIGRNRITVTKIKYADGYELYRALRPDGEFKLIGTMIELSVDHTQLKPGQTYYYKVRAFRRTAKGNIYSKFSEVKSCTAW